MSSINSVKLSSVCCSMSALRCSITSARENSNTAFSVIKLTVPILVPFKIWRYIGIQWHPTFLIYIDRDGHIWSFELYFAHAVAKSQHFKFDRFKIDGNLRLADEMWNNYWGFLNCRSRHGRYNPASTKKIRISGRNLQELWTAKWWKNRDGNLQGRD